MNTLDQSIISLLLQFRKIILFTPLLNLYSLFLNFIYLLFIMSKNIRSHPINTFNQKPSVQQILSYLVIIAQIIIFYVCIYQNITNSHINIAISILFGLSCILLFISGAITSYIDPSDPVVNIYYQSKSNNKQFKAENYLYCNTCDSFCDQTSKHCKLCKRCVNQFDHHCVWINNCIGKANYKQFIFMIIATFIHLSLFLIGGIILSIENGYQINLGSMVTVWIFMLIVGILDLLDLYLIILHFYLIYKGISTFQLILIRRQEQRKKIKQEQIEGQRKQRKNKENKVHNYSQFQNTQQVNQSLKKIEKIEKKQQKIEKIQQISKFEETELRRKQSKGQMTEGAGSVVQKQLKQQSQEIRQQVNSIGQISQRELDKVIKQSQQEQGGSKNLKISNFFRQNKSLKLIISSNNVETPKKVNKMKNFSFAG